MKRTGGTNTIRHGDGLVTPFDPRLPIIARAAKVKTCHAFHCWHAMRDMQPFHIAAFAAFAGLEERHVTAIMAAIQIHAPLTAKRASVARGTRLPHDWTIPDDWIEWATIQRRWYPADCEAESLLFANYWQAKSGQGATKLDWFKTWQNWARNSHRPDGTYAKSTSAPVDFAEQTRRTADLYDRMGRTVEAAELRASIDSNVVPITRAAG
jgi:hypothetical protein